MVMLIMMLARMLWMIMLSITPWILAVLLMTRVLTAAPVLLILWRQLGGDGPDDQHSDGSCGGADAGRCGDLVGLGVHEGSAKARTDG
jgi:hypothetical protein